MIGETGFHIRKKRASQTTGDCPAKRALGPIAAGFFGFGGEMWKLPSCPASSLHNKTIHPQLLVSSPTRLSARNFPGVPIGVRPTVGRS